jgi:Family of unknown function (DUF6011)
MHSPTFDCYDARLHTLPDKPTLRVATHEQLVEHRDRLQVLNADKILPRFGTVADDEHGFFESSCHGMLQYEDFWQQCGLVFAWIDQKPVWMSAADWLPYGETGFPPLPTRPCRRIFRLSLIGGGQIRVTEHCSRALFESDKSFWPEGAPELLVTAHADEGLRRYSGRLSHGAVCEMATYAVLFVKATPQDIVDRVAATLRAIDTTPENFFALLDGSTGCAFCNRPLTDEVSKLIGVGPDCARQSNIPHNLTAASRRLELRRKLLGDVDPEMATQAPAEPPRHLTPTVGD